MNPEIKPLVRPNILRMKPYSSARDEFTGKAKIFLDANENPYGSSYKGVTLLNRYPDPRQEELRTLIAQVKGRPVEQVFAANGSDEILDLIYRIFCRPGTDNVLIQSPTYGMYEVLAGAHDIEVRKVNLSEDFQPDTEALLQQADENSRILFVCSPNNPTGNLVDKETLEEILEGFPGMVLVDEAYVDFSPEGSVAGLLESHPRLMVMQTFSKAWGQASLRLGVLLAHPDITGLLQKVKLPYHLNKLTTSAAMKVLSDPRRKDFLVQRILEEKARLQQELQDISIVHQVFPSDANFFLVRFSDARLIYRQLLDRGIVVRDRSTQVHCDNCLRITVGTEPENNRLLQSLREIDGTADAPATAEGVTHERITGETKVLIHLDTRGSGWSDIQTGLYFFDHMLQQVAMHAGWDMLLHVAGDLETDEHHVMEDVAITLGQAVAVALKTKKSIRRYGFNLPMDDSLAQVAIDLGGRSWMQWKGDFQREYVGDLPTEMLPHFFRSFTDHARCSLHITVQGENEHHMAEAVFKAFARSLRAALEEDTRLEMPSTKGSM